MSNVSYIEVETWKLVVYCPYCNERIHREDYPEQVIYCPKCAKAFAVINLVKEDSSKTERTETKAAWDSAKHDVTGERVAQFLKGMAVGGLFVAVCLIVWLLIFNGVVR